MLNNRNAAGWTISAVYFCAILFLPGQVCSGQKDESKRERKAVVSDANQVPVVGAKVYRRTAFIRDAQKSGVYLSEDAKAMYETDANGEFIFELPQRSAGVLFLILDEGLSKIGHLRVQRRDQNDVHTVIVSEPAHIKATLESRQVPLSDLLVDIGFFDTQQRTIHEGFITIDLSFDEPVTSIPLDIVCPDGCHLKFTARTQQSLKDIEYRDIPPLAPGEVFDLGRIAIDPVYSHPLTGKKPPRLDVSEWAKGKPATLEALKGKVVLLDFWGLWCPPCRKKFPELVRLHKKYARDGLVIIAIHDSSVEKESLIKQGRKAINLSDVRFRVAIDSPTSGPSDTQVKAVRKGKTIAAYGVSTFPTLVLIAPDGKVDSVGADDLEKRINLLLYGHTKNLKKEPSFLQELLLLAKKEFLLAGIGIIGLLLVGIYCVVRSISNKQTKQV